MTPIPLMIDTPVALTDLVLQAHQCGSIALDTEFVWERTYYPRLGLIQVALESGACFLVDTLALADLSLLGTLLSAPRVAKILHDAPQDLMILRRATGAFPANVFDTRCAAGLAGLSSTTSLAGLVAATVGVELAKTESRTNWLQRPLTAKQIRYAAEDVCYLHAVRDKLQQRVDGMGRSRWLREELAILDDPSLYQEREPGRQYQRIKGSGRISRSEAAILQELAAWREQEARRCDRPRGRVMTDGVLLQLARRKPRSPAALADIRGLGARHHEAVLKCILRGMTAAGSQTSTRLRRLPDAVASMEAQVAAAMAQLRACARAQTIDPPFIASRAEVQALIAAGAHATPAEHRLLRGWRRELIGQQLLDLLREDPPPQEAAESTP